MSKNIKRDEKGCSILPGAQTFGTATAKPMGGRKQPRHYSMRERAANHFAHLADHGQKEPPPLDPEQAEALREQNEFARLPNEVKMAYYQSRLDGLKKELQELSECKNDRKIAFMIPALRIEIDMVLDCMRGLKEEMND